MAKEKASAPGILARAGAELIKVQTNARNMGVVEFIETIVDAFTVPLFLSQRVLLKSIYGEELDNVTLRSLCGPTEGACKNKGCSADHRLLLTEQQLMDQWVKTEKTNWRHPRAILSQKNMARSLEGKDLLKRFDYQAITVQAGMRCLVGSSYVFVDGQGYKRLDELIEPTSDEPRTEYASDLRVVTRNGIKDVVNTLARPVTPTIKVTTASGLVIEGTPEHPLFAATAEGQHWQLMANLKLGDALRVHSRPMPEAAYPASTESEAVLELATLMGRWSLIKPDVPAWVMSGSLKVTEAYLRGLGALEAGVKKATFEFNYEQTSIQTQLLLLSRGVQSSRARVGDCWVLEILPHGQSREYDPILSIEHGEAPVYDICVPDGSEYVANGIVSSNSSKSASMALLGAYEFFKAITHECIQAEMGLPKSSPLYITAVASTERQALGTIFYYIKEYITKSTFFKTFIDSDEIQVRELDISFPSKNIIIASGHSQATGFVGRTALMVLFDELAMFSADESNTSNAADVYQRIGRSTATAKHLGKIIALSSVKCEGDFMETLVEGDWERQEHGALVFDLSTFDVNPLLDLDEPSIKQAYDKDLVSAQRDFENIRPGAINQFLIPEVIAKACEGRDPQEFCKYAAMPIFRKRGEALQASGSITIDEEAEDELREMAGLQIAAEPVTSHLIQSYAHCDPGVKHDSFGFACGHPEYIEGLGVATVIDICLEWMPRALGKNKFALVDLVNVEEVLIEIAKARRVCQVTFDHWNASASVQRLWREGIVARELHFGAGLQKRMFENFRARLNQGLIRIPNHPTLIEELECLELRGERIDHPKGKESKIPGRARVSKDLADAVVAVDYAISQLEREFVRTQSYGGAVPGRGHANIKLVGQTRASRANKWNSR